MDAPQARKVGTRSVRVQGHCRRVGLQHSLGVRVCEVMGRHMGQHSGKPGCHLFQDSSRIFPERQCQQLPKCPVGISGHEAPRHQPGQVVLGTCQAQAKGQLKIVCLANGARLGAHQPGSGRCLGTPKHHCRALEAALGRQALEPKARCVWGS